MSAAAAFRRKGRKVWMVKVPDLEDGGWVDRTSTTRDRLTARKMQAAIDALATMQPPPREILGRVVDGTLAVPSFYALFVEAGGDVGAIRARLADIDLGGLVAPFCAALQGKVSADTVAHYRAALQTYFAPGAVVLRSQLTQESIQAWLDTKAAQPATVRKHAVAMRRFVDWLERRGTLDRDVMRRVEVPRPPAPRIHFLDTADAIRLADAQPAPYRELSALLAGTAIDVSTALALRCRDVDVGRKRIRAAGTKTHQRDRVVRVADWAWVYVERLVAQKLPDAKLFPEIPTRWAAGDVHRAAIAHLVGQGLDRFAGYWMKDARHTWAVRAMRAGVPLEVMRQQMGHATGTLILTTYGRFAPTADEQDHWERVASAADAQRREVK